MSKGREIIEELEEHVRNIMLGMPECAAGSGNGAGYKALEEMADLDLNLPKQNGWLTWSILWSMEGKGIVEIVPGTEKRRKWRLKNDQD